MNRSMNQNMFSRIELGFWNLAIQALSQSQMTRQLFAGSYRLVHDQTLMRMALLLAISGLIGLFSGYAFYIFSLTR